MAEENETKIFTKGTGHQKITQKFVRIAKRTQKIEAKGIYAKIQAEKNGRETKTKTSLDFPTNRSWKNG